MGARLFIKAVDGRPVDEELTYPFDQPRLLFGRSASADVRLPHGTVSERHAMLEQGQGAYTLTDLGSTNGTRIGRERLVPHRPRRLREGDEIELGIYRLSFHDELLVTAPLTADRTAELARRLLRANMMEGQVPTAPPRLVVLSGRDQGHSFVLPPAPCRVSIGSEETCELALSDPKVLPIHLELSRDLDGVLVHSIEAQTPFELGTRHLTRARLRDGDELRLGTTVLLFEDPVEAELAALRGIEDEQLRARPQSIAAPIASTATTSKSPASGIGPAAAANTPVPQEGDAPASDAEKQAPRSDDTVGDSGGLHPAFAARRGASAPADLIIYALAGIILTMSIAGLLVLFRAG